LARWPLLEPFVVLALETVSIPLVAGWNLATMHREAREASRVRLRERKAVQRALLVLAFSKRSPPQAPLS
jgi:hypothetical protein